MYAELFTSCSAENRPGPSNLGNVISQILLCKQITPDFRQEELCSITKDSQDVRRMVQDMQEFMPQQENSTGLYHSSLSSLRFFYFFIILFSCLLLPSYSVLHFYSFPFLSRFTSSDSPSPSFLLHLILCFILPLLLVLAFNVFGCLLFLSIFHLSFDKIFVPT
jgi:hypothetical protein